MNKRLSIFSLLVTLSLNAAAANQPNILFVLADDQGKKGSGVNH